MVKEHRSARDSYFIRSLLTFYMGWEVVFFLLNLALLYVGLKLYLLHDSSDDSEGNLVLSLSDIEWKYKVWMSWLGVLILVMASTGAGSGLVGIAAAIYENKNIFLFSLILMLLSVGASVATLFQSKTVANKMTDRILRRAILEHLQTKAFEDPLTERRSIHDLDLETWQKIQTAYRCCGVNSFLDWRDSMWFTNGQLFTSDFSKRIQEQLKNRGAARRCVPKSCCVDDHSGTGFSSELGSALVGRTRINVLQCQEDACTSNSVGDLNNNGSVIYEKGCYEALKGENLAIHPVHKHWLIFQSFVNVIYVPSGVTFLLSLWVYLLRLKIAHQEQVEEQEVEEAIKEAATARAKQQFVAETIIT